MQRENNLTVREIEKENNGASAAYDLHLLKGHFEELNEIPAEQLNGLLLSADDLLKKSKTEKNQERILLQIESLKLYLEALALNDKCLINDTEGLFSFVCIRHPELDLDWITLQKIIFVSEKRKIEYSDQKTLELAINLYISAINKDLKKAQTT